MLSAQTNENTYSVVESLVVPCRPIDLHFV